MNATKWDEFLRILLEHERAGITLRIKLLYGKPFACSSIWRPTRRYTEVGGAPFQNREIEWMEVTGTQAAKIRDQAAHLGKLPIVDCEGGFRVVAYRPIQIV